MSGLSLSSLRKIAKSGEPNAISFQTLADSQYLQTHQAKLDEMKAAYKTGMDVVYSGMTILCPSISQLEDKLKKAPPPVPAQQRLAGDIDNTLLEPVVGKLRVEEGGVTFAVPEEKVSDISEFEELRKARLEAESNLKIGMKDSVHTKYGPEEIFREFVSAMAATAHDSCQTLATFNELDELQKAEEGNSKAKSGMLDDSDSDSDSGSEEEDAEKSASKIAKIANSEKPKSSLPLYVIYNDYKYRTEAELEKSTKEIPRLESLITQNSRKYEEISKQVADAKNEEEKNEKKELLLDLGAEIALFNKQMGDITKQNHITKPPVANIRQRVYESASKSFDTKIFEGRMRKPPGGDLDKAERKEYNNSEHTWNIFPKVVYSIASQGYSYNKQAMNVNDTFHEEIVRWFDVPEFIGHLPSEDHNLYYEDWEFNIDASNGINKFRPDPVTRTFMFRCCNQAVKSYDSNLHKSLFYYAVRGLNVEALQVLVLGLSLETLEEMICHCEHFQSSLMDVSQLLEKLSLDDENYRDPDKDQDTEKESNDEDDDDEDDNEEDDDEEDEEDEEDDNLEQKKAELAFDVNDTVKEWNKEPISFASTCNPLFRNLRNPALKSIVQIVSLIKNGTAQNSWRNKAREVFLFHEMGLDKGRKMFLDLCTDQISKHLWSKEEKEQVQGEVKEMEVDSDQPPAKTTSRVVITSGDLADIVYDCTRREYFSNSLIVEEYILNDIKNLFSSAEEVTPVTKVNPKVVETSSVVDELRKSLRAIQTYATNKENAQDFESKVEDFIEHVKTTLNTPTPEPKSVTGTAPAKTPTPSESAATLQTTTTTPITSEALKEALAVTMETMATTSTTATTAPAPASTVAPKPDEDRSTSFNTVVEVIKTNSRVFKLEKQVDAWFTDTERSLTTLLEDNFGTFTFSNKNVRRQYEETFTSFKKTFSRDKCVLRVNSILFTIHMLKRLDDHDIFEGVVNLNNYNYTTSHASEKFIDARVFKRFAEKNDHFKFKHINNESHSLYQKDLDWYDEYATMCTDIFKPIESEDTLIVAGKKPNTLKPLRGRWNTNPWSIIDHNTKETLAEPSPQFNIELVIRMFEISLTLPAEFVNRRWGEIRFFPTSEDESSLSSEQPKPPKRVKVDDSIQVVQLTEEQEKRKNAFLDYYMDQICETDSAAFLRDHLERKSAQPPSRGKLEFIRTQRPSKEQQDKADKTDGVVKGLRVIENPEVILKGENFYVIENTRSLLSLWKDARQHTLKKATRLFDIADEGCLRSLHTLHAEFSYYLRDTKETVSTLSSSLVAMVSMDHVPWNLNVYLSSDDNPALLKDVIRTTYNEDSLTRVDVLRMKEHYSTQDHDEEVATKKRGHKDDTLLEKKLKEFGVFFEAADKDRWTAEEKTNIKTLRKVILDLNTECWNVRYRIDKPEEDFAVVSEILSMARRNVALNKTPGSLKLDSERANADDIQKGLDEQHGVVLKVNSTLRACEEVFRRCFNLAAQAREFSEKRQFTNRMYGGPSISKPQRKIDGFLDFHLNLLYASHYLEKMDAYSDWFDTDNDALMEDLKTASVDGYDDFFKVFLGTSEERRERSTIIDVGWIADKLQTEYERPVFLQDRLRSADVGEVIVEGVVDSDRWGVLQEWLENAGKFFSLFLETEKVLKTNPSTLKERALKQRMLVEMTTKTAGQVNIAAYMIAASYLKDRDAKALGNMNTFIDQVIANKNFDAVDANSKKITITDDFVREINRQFPNITIKPDNVVGANSRNTKTFNFVYSPMPSSLKIKAAFREEHVLGMMLVLEKMKSDMLKENVTDVRLPVATLQRQLLDYFMTLEDFIKEAPSALTESKREQNTFFQLLLFACAKLLKGNVVTDITKSKRKRDWQGLVWNIPEKNIASDESPAKTVVKIFDFESTKANIWFSLFNNDRFMELRTARDWFGQATLPKSSKSPFYSRLLNALTEKHHTEIFNKILAFIDTGKTIPLLTQKGTQIALQSVFYPLLSKEGANGKSLVLADSPELAEFFGKVFPDNPKLNEFTYNFTSITFPDFTMVANIVFDDNDVEDTNFKSLVSHFAEIELTFKTGQAKPKFVHLFTRFCQLLVKFVQEVDADWSNFKKAAQKTMPRQRSTDLLGQDNYDISVELAARRLAAESHQKTLDPIDSFTKKIDIEPPKDDDTADVKKKKLATRKLMNDRFGFLWHFVIACMTKWADIRNSFLDWTWLEKVKEDSLGFGLSHTVFSGTTSFILNPKIRQYTKQMTEEFRLVMMQEMRYRMQKTLLSLPNMLYKRAALSEGSVLQLAREHTLVSSVVLLTRAIVSEITEECVKSGSLTAPIIRSIEGSLKSLCLKYRETPPTLKTEADRRIGAFAKTLDDMEKLTTSMAANRLISLKWHALHYMARELWTGNINIETVMEMRRVVMGRSCNVTGGAYSVCDLNQLEELFRCHQDIFHVSQSKSKFPLFLFYYSCHVTSKDGDDLFLKLTNDPPEVRLMKTLTDTIAQRIPEKWEKYRPVGNYIFSEDLSAMAEHTTEGISENDTFETAYMRKFQERVFTMIKEDRFRALSFCAYIMNLWTSSISELVNGLRTATKDGIIQEDDAPDKDEEPQNPESLFFNTKDSINNTMQIKVLDRYWEQLRYLPVIVDTCLVALLQYVDGMNSGAEIHLLEDEVLSHFILDYNRLARHRNRTSSFLLSLKYFKISFINEGGIIKDLNVTKDAGLIAKLKDRVLSTFSIDHYGEETGAGTKSTEERTIFFNEFVEKVLSPLSIEHSDRKKEIGKMAEFADFFTGKSTFFELNGRDAINNILLVLDIEKSDGKSDDTKAAAALATKRESTKSLREDLLEARTLNSFIEKMNPFLDHRNAYFLDSDKGLDIIRKNIEVLKKFSDVGTLFNDMVRAMRPEIRMGETNLPQNIRSLFDRQTSPYLSIPFLQSIQKDEYDKVTKQSEIEGKAKAAAILARMEGKSNSEPSQKKAKKTQGGSSGEFVHSATTLLLRCPSATRILTLIKPNKNSGAQNPHRVFLKYQEQEIQKCLEDLVRAEIKFTDATVTNQNYTLSFDEVVEKFEKGGDDASISCSSKADEERVKNLLDNMRCKSIQESNLLINTFKGYAKPKLVNELSGTPKYSVLEYTKELLLLEPFPDTRATSMCYRESLRTLRGLLAVHSSLSSLYNSVAEMGDVMMEDNLVATNSTVAGFDKKRDLALRAWNIDRIYTSGAELIFVTFMNNKKDKDQLFDIKLDKTRTTAEKRAKRAETKDTKDAKEKEKATQPDTK